MTLSVTNVVSVPTRSSSSPEFGLLSSEAARLANPRLAPADAGQRLLEESTNNPMRKSACPGIFIGAGRAMLSGPNGDTALR